LCSHEESFGGRFKQRLLPLQIILVINSMQTRLKNLLGPLPSLTVFAVRWFCSAIELQGYPIVLQCYCAEVQCYMEL